MTEKWKIKIPEYKIESDIFQFRLLSTITDVCGFREAGRYKMASFYPLLSESRQQAPAT